MRRLLSFECEGEALGASRDGDANAAVGILIVTGGTQTRIGSHRLFERLGAALAERGFAVFRFDRRGIGDSEGDDPGFRGNGPDIAAAAAAFRAGSPGLRRIYGLGLCDGATSLALFGAEAGLDGLIMFNPWLIEAEAAAPPPAAIRHHYRRRLLSLEGWKKLLTGSISYRKLLKGVRKSWGPATPAGLAGEVGEALARSPLRVELILARHDATAVAAHGAWNSKILRSLLKDVPNRTSFIETDAHTFSRPGDWQALLSASTAAIERFGGSGGD